MSRPRYPSDSARRQRPHVKVHLSWMTHPKYAEAWRDPEIRGIIVGLWQLAAQAHASSTGGWVTLTPGLIAALTGRERAGAGLARLRCAARAMSYTVRCEAGTVSVLVRNFAKKQGFTPQTPAESPQHSAPSEEPKNRRTKEPKNQREREPASPAASAPERWAQMFSQESPQPPQGAVAWVASVLPVIEGEADAAFPREPPTPQARTGKVRALLWRYWRHEQANGWKRPEGRVNGNRRPTVIEETKRELERRRAERARLARGSVPALVAGVATDGRGHD